jgi:hypothetical protein
VSDSTVASDYSSALHSPDHPRRERNGERTVVVYLIWVAQWRRRSDCPWTRARIRAFGLA